MSRSFFPALMLIVAGAGAGCGGTPETASDDHESAPKAEGLVPPFGPAAAAGLSEPALPDEAQANGAAGAEAFVDYYWDLVAYAGWSGDTTTLEAVGDGCLGCVDLTNVITKLHATGQRLRTELLDVSVTDLLEVGDNWDLTAHVTSESVTITPSGSPKGSARRGTRQYWMIVTFDDGWKVAEMVPL